MRKSRKKTVKNLKPDKIVILIASLAAILIITVFGFQASGELSSAGSGFVIAAGAAFTIPAILSIILFTFLVLKIRK